MQKRSFRFTHTKVDYYFDGSLSSLRNLVDPETAILITDENVFAAHQKKFKHWNTIVLKPGEEYKVQLTVDAVIEQLIEMGADRNTTLIGVGGGVITDITGYVASVYMRGINFAFIPSSLLAMVDASIGGKNGIDVGVYKNMVGAIRQPSFIFFDTSLLASLPEREWRNGFAEVIKHAVIKDAKLFRMLAEESLKFFRNKTALKSLIQKNVLIKTKVVQEDEFEEGNRKLLNFGHTLGHALETQYELSHGEAISIGMVYAAQLSQKLSGFKDAEGLITLLQKYGLPTFAEFDKEKVIHVLKSDKKKEKNSINFILLKKIGAGIIQQISIDELYQTL